MSRVDSLWEASMMSVLKWDNPRCTRAGSLDAAQPRAVSIWRDVTRSTVLSLYSFSTNKNHVKQHSTKSVPCSEEMWWTSTSWCKGTAMQARANKWLDWTQNFTLKTEFCKDKYNFHKTAAGLLFLTFFSWLVLKFCGKARLFKLNLCIYRSANKKPQTNKNEPTGFKKKINFPRLCLVVHLNIETRRDVVQLGKR